MSDAGDEVQVDAPAEVEVAAEAPKGKLSVEDALQVRPPYCIARYPESEVLPATLALCSKF